MSIYIYIYGVYDIIGVYIVSSLRPQLYKYYILWISDLGEMPIRGAGENWDSGEVTVEDLKWCGWLQDEYSYRVEMVEVMITNQGLNDNIT